MARTKNNFLNAKPVSKIGGGSGGVRNPRKPYKKPPTRASAERPARWDAKTKTEQLRDAAKTKPKSPAPKQVMTKPVTRSGPVKGPVPPKGGSVTMPNSRRAGVNLPKEGVRAERIASRVAQLKEAARTRSTPKPASSGAASGAGSAARGLLRGAGRLAGRVALPLGIGAAAADVMRVGRQNQRWNEYKQQTGMNKSSSKPAPAKPSSKPQQQGPQQTQQMVDSYRASRDARHQSLRDKMPAPRPSASRPSQSTPSSRTTSGGSSSQRQPVAPKAAKPATPGRKWEDFNPGRGTSKSNNPLLDRDSGGIKLRDRMKDREATQQAEKAKSLQSKFGEDPGYQPQTKVDGSKYADKKPDMNKVNEYDRRKRRYYD